jgi:hypothetical protein
MSALREAYDMVCGLITSMALERDTDVARIREETTDWCKRDHEIRVRHARFVVESAYLERNRMWMVRELAVENRLKPVVITFVP